MLSRSPNRTLTSIPLSEMIGQQQGAGLPIDFDHDVWGERAPRVAASDDEDSPDANGVDTELEDAAQQEQDYLRGRLRDELGREPTEEELSEWLRQHTEGY